MTNNLFGNGSALIKTGEDGEWTIYKTKDGLTGRVKSNRLSDAAIEKFNRRYNKVITETIERLIDEEAR